MIDPFLFAILCPNVIYPTKFEKRLLHKFGTYYNVHVEPSPDMSENPERILCFFAGRKEPFVPQLFHYIRDVIDNNNNNNAVVAVELLLQKAIKVAREENERQVENDLYIFLDAHLNNSGLQSVFSLQSLPDGTEFLPLVLTYNESEISNTRLAKKTFKFMDDFNIDLVVSINHLLYKAIPERCYSRKHEKGMFLACKKSPHLFDFVSKIVLASALGVYESAEVKANIETRKRILSLFRNGIVWTSLLDELCAKNSQQLLYMVKEYFYEMVQRNHGLHRVFCMQYDWPTLREQQMVMCDAIREQINNNNNNNNDSGVGFLFNGIQAALDRERERFVPSKSAPPHTTDIKNNLDEILEICNKFNLTHYNIDYDNLRNGEEFSLKDPIPRDIVPKKLRELMEDVLYALKDYIWKTRKTHKVTILPIQWLVAMGIPSEKLLGIRSKMYLKTTKLRDEFEKLTEYEYAVVYTFFKIHHEMTIYFEYPSNAYTYYMHIMAAKNMLDLKDGCEFPSETSGTTLACDNCLELKNQVLYRKNVTKQLGRGAGDVMYDDFGRILCARRPYKNEWRETYKETHGKYPEGPPRNAKNIRSTASSEIRKITKRIATQHTLHRCQYQRARAVCGFGHDFTYDNVDYFACYGCLKVVSFEERYMFGSDNVCYDCMKKCGAYQKKNQELCEYCNAATALKPLDKRYSFYLYDDTVELCKQGYRQMFFCKSHGTMSWLVDHEDEFKMKSVAMLGLKNHWGSKNFKGEIIQVWTTCDGTSKI